MKILSITISFVLLAAGCKKNIEKPQAPPTRSITYTTNVDLTTIQQAIRGFGGATVFRPDINTLLGNPIDNQLGSIVSKNVLTEKREFNVNGWTIPVSFMSRITSNIKNIASESAGNVAGTSFTYNLSSLSITTYLNPEKYWL